MDKETAKCIYEKAKEKAFHIEINGFATETRAINLIDLAEICQIPLLPKELEEKGEALSSPAGVEPGTVRIEKAKEVLLKLVREAIKCAEGQRGLELELHVENIIGNIYPDFGVEMYELSKSKPVEEAVADGYVAWHPEKGAQIKTAQVKEHNAWYELRKSFVFTPESGPPTEEQLKANGWQIRPVRLVFTDEGKK